jgi:hypothetical protein
MAEIVGRKPRYDVGTFYYEPRPIVRIPTFNLFCARRIVCALALGSMAAAAQTLPSNWVARSDGGGVWYEPTDLPQGAVFHIWAAPPVVVGNVTAPQAFVQARQQQGLHGIGTQGLQAQCDEAQVSKESVTQTCKLLGTNRPTLNAQFVMLPVQNGAAYLLRIVTVGDSAVLSPYKDGMKTAMQLATQRWVAAAKQSAETTTATTKNTVSARTDKPRTDKEQAAQERLEARSAIERQIRTEPGKGLQVGDYETVLFSWKQTMTVTGLQYEETIYLLLKDGTAYEDPEIPPEDFNAAASKRLQPERWVDWRKNGKTYQVGNKHKNEWETLSAWPGIPAKPNEVLGHTYTHSAYASYGGLGGYASTSSFVFKPNNQFEQVGYTSMGTGVLQGLNGYTAGSTSVSNGQGTRSSTSVIAGGGNNTNLPTMAGGTSSKRNDGAGNRGTYRLNGWTIELYRDNGVVERQLFLFTSDKRTGINIAGVDFLRADKR